MSGAIAEPLLVTEERTPAAQVKPKTKAEIFNLPAFPKGDWKSLDYTPEQLGFKRKFKGRAVNVNGEPWLITHATPHLVYISRNNETFSCDYNQLRKNHPFLD